MPQRKHSKSSHRNSKSKSTPNQVKNMVKEEWGEAKDKAQEVWKDVTK